MRSTPFQILLAALFGLVVGWTLGPGPGGSPAPPGTTLVEVSHYESLRQLSAAAEERRIRVEEELVQLRAERGSLVKRAERAEEALAAAAVLAEAGSGATVPEGVIVFGEWGELAEIRDADWNELGGAIRSINEVVEPLFADIRDGNPPSAAAQQRVMTENNKLVKYGVSILDKLPTNATMQVNGEFTHPLSLINMIAAMLREAGLPLAASQSRELIAIGESYDRVFAELNASYDEFSWVLTKLLDELTLKRDTMLEVEAVLTPPQRAVVVVPEIQHRMRLDTLSPVNMVLLSARVLPIGAIAELESTLVGVWTGAYEVDGGFLAPHGDLWARYAEELAGVLAPVPSTTIPFAHLDDLIVAGRAQERLFLDLLDRGAFTPEQGVLIAGSEVWWLPRLGAVED